MFSHSFSSDFYSNPEVDFSQDQPQTVEHALQAAILDPQFKTDLEMFLYGQTFDYELDCLFDDVLTHIVKTDTATSLSSPVEVWIDSDGDLTLTVY